MTRPPSHVPRAPRLPVRAPIACRRANGTRWEGGYTLNISRSGVLFVVADASDVAGPVEFVINLSLGALKGPGVPMLPDLHCQGRVVRSRPDPDGRLVIAACIRRQSIRKAQTFFVAT